MSNRPRTSAVARRTLDNSGNNSINPRNASDVRKSKNSGNHHNHHRSDHFADDDSHRDALNLSDSDTVTVSSSILQPRLAVVLGVSEAWHPVLFLCRLLSIGPAVSWGVPMVIRLLAMLHLMFGSAYFSAISSPGAGPDAPPSKTDPDLLFEARLRFTETILATIWCGASGYLSFFFTDCLMSRWLVNYTVQATIVRLLTIAATNIYLTSCALRISGASADPRLQLPVWIAISTTLTVMYHITQRKINIRKETSMSISVFSIASYISMVALLALLDSNRSHYPPIPLVTMAHRAWEEAGKAAVKIMEYTVNMEELL